MSFENTQYARDYFQCQVPTIIRTLKQIAANQEKQIELQQQALQAIVMPQKVFAGGILYITQFVCSFIKNWFLLKSHFPSKFPLCALDTPYFSVKIMIFY